MSTPECSPQRVTTHRIAKQVTQILFGDPNVKAHLIKSVMDSPGKQTHKILERDGIINTKDNREKAIMYDCIIGAFDHAWKGTL